MKVMNGRGSFTASGAPVDSAAATPAAATDPDPDLLRRRLPRPGVLGFLEHLALGLVDPVTERGVNHDDDLVAGALVGEGPHRFVELGQAGRAPTFRGQVRSVDDDAPTSRCRWCHVAISQAFAAP